MQPVYFAGDGAETQGCRSAKQTQPVYYRDKSGWEITTALRWWEMVAQANANVFNICLLLPAEHQACVGNTTERAPWPEVTGENVLLVEKGDIPLKFTANLNLMGHSLSFWRRTETPLTWELLFGLCNRVSGKKVTMSKVRQRDTLQGEMCCVVRGEVYGFVALHLTLNLLSHYTSGKNIAEDIFIHPFL